MREIANFMFEMLHLKKIKHEGWRLAGVPYPDSVADHGLVASQFAYILAVLEKFPEPEKIAAILAFHDMEETRIGDLHKLAINYVEKDEEKAVSEQTAPLGEIGKKIKELWAECEEKKTKAGQIAKDADRLEQALQAKEYMDQGFPTAEDWIKNIRVSLFTESAKKLLEEIAKTDSKAWWQGKKKISRFD